MQVMTLFLVTAAITNWWRMGGFLGYSGLSFAPVANSGSPGVMVVLG
jgi:hypothetical protein